MKRLALLIVALALSGCLATASAYQSMVATGDDGPRPVASKVVFFALLPLFVAVDVVTAPFQYVYVVTHAR